MKLMKNNDYTSSPAKIIFMVCLFLIGIVTAQAKEVEQLMPAPGESCEMPVKSDAHPTGYITGAGAHFSWIIFKSMQQDLERVAGQKIMLYGKDSMLGQGCNAGIRNAQLSGPGKESFGFVCCPLSKEEVAKKKLIVYPLAIEPILILVNRTNPINNLSRQQIRDIFSGKITNWKEVGGNDQPITVITRLHCKKRPGHWKTILPDAKDFRKVRLNVSSADEMVKRVGDFENAIGHIGSTWEFESGDHIKRIKVDNIEPTAATLANKTYPFYRVLSAITNEHPTQSLKRLIHEAQTGKSFFKVARQFNLLPLNKPAAE